MAGEHTLAEHHDAHLHPLTNILTKCQPSTLLRNPRNSLGQDFKTQSHYDNVRGQIKITT